MITCVNFNLCASVYVCVGICILCVVLSRVHDTCISCCCGCQDYMYMYYYVIVVITFAYNSFEVYVYTINSEGFLKE